MQVLELMCFFLNREAVRRSEPEESRGLWGLYRDDGKENGNYYLGFRV